MVQWLGRLLIDGDSPFENPQILCESSPACSTCRFEVMPPGFNIPWVGWSCFPVYWLDATENVTKTRYTCVFWNQLIKDEVWGSVPGRKGSSTRLRHRWVNFEPRLDCLGLTKDTPMISSIFYNWDREGISSFPLGRQTRTLRTGVDIPTIPRGSNWTTVKWRALLVSFWGPPSQCWWHTRSGERISAISLMAWRFTTWSRMKRKREDATSSSTTSMLLLSSKTLLMGGPLREVHLPRKSPIETKANFLAAFCDILQITQSLQTTQSTIKIYSHPEYFNIGTYHGNWDQLWPQQSQKLSSIYYTTR